MSSAWSTLLESHTPERAGEPMIAALDTLDRPPWATRVGGGCRCCPLPHPPISRLRRRSLRAGLRPVLTPEPYRAPRPARGRGQQVGSGGLTSARGSWAGGLTAPRTRSSREVTDASARAACRCSSDDSPPGWRRGPGLRPPPRRRNGSLGPVGEAYDQFADEVVASGEAQEGTRGVA